MPSGVGGNPSAVPGPGLGPQAPPTAPEDMSVVQKCEQLEACLVECHAAMEQMEVPQETKTMDVAATPNAPGARASLDRLQGSAHRLRDRLEALHASLGQI